MKKVLIFISFFLVTTAIMAVFSWSVADDKSSPDASHVKVLSFNVRYGAADDGENSWSHRKEMLADLIKSGHYDFIGLQECLIHPDSDKNQLEYLKTQLGKQYGSIAKCREKDPDQGESCAIFYDKIRWKLDAGETGTFWLSETPDEPGSKSWDTACPRVVTWGRFTDQTTKKSVYVYNTHFDHISKPARAHSAAMLMNHIANRKHSNDPVFLTGDFNCGEKSVPIQYLSEKSITPESKTLPAQTLLKDSYRETYPDVDESAIATFHGFTGMPVAKEKIDYIFTSPAVKTLDSEILKTNRDGRYPSDHFPVEATFELK